LPHSGNESFHAEQAGVSGDEAEPFFGLLGSVAEFGDGLASM
jgi:hypothetical protein